MSQGNNAPTEFGLVHVFVIVRRLEAAPGKGMILARTEVKARAVDLPGVLSGRACGSCGHFDKKTRERGCEVEVHAGFVQRKGSKVHYEKTSGTCIGSPEKIGEQATNFARELIDLLKNQGNTTEGAREVWGDVLSTSTSLISEVYNGLPLIHAAANGDPEAAMASVAGMVKTMATSDDGKKTLQDLGAAVGGDASKMAEIKDAMRDFPGGNILFDFLAQAQGAFKPPQQ